MSTKDHPAEPPAAPGSGLGSGNPPGSGTAGSNPAGPVSRPHAAEEPPRSRPALRRALDGRGRRCLAAVLALLVVAAVVVGVVLSTRSSPGQPASGVPVTGTATVQRRDLVETDTEAGTISYAHPQAVYNQLNGTITWLPSVGQLVRPGQSLYDVNAQPVILMNGTTPAYRELTSSDSDGQDILQLNRNLVNLGFNPGGIVIDDAWQAATTAGVDALQASLGQAKTGSLSLGQIVFLRGDQIISAVGTGLGSASGGGDPSGSTGSAASATPILQTTSTQLIVTVDLSAGSQGEAKAGETVTVEMPAENIVQGVITAVSPVAASNSSNSSGSSSAAGSSPGSQATVPVTIKLKGRVSGAALDQAPVSVNFSQAVAKSVLSVPVTALLATPGGKYVVKEALVPHRLIPVTTGLFAAGYVQISGPGIYPGLQVTNSQG